MSDDLRQEEEESQANWAAFERKSARTAVMRLPSDPGPFRHLAGVWHGHTEELREVRRADGTTRLVRDVVLLEVRIVEDGRCPGCGRPLTA
jgi:hypothetical protein